MIASWIIPAIYLGLLLWLIRGWVRLKKCHSERPPDRRAGSEEPHHSGRKDPSYRQDDNEKRGEIPHKPALISIVIVARNESANLPSLLSDLKNLSYPSERIDIWLVDDHSEDDTASIGESADINVIRLSALTPRSENISFKKWGLTEAIKRCRGEIILSTDADCRVPNNWVERMTAQFADEEVNAVAGPVVMQNKGGLLGHFQQQDMLGMQLITGGGLAYRWPLLANGANLAFRKSAFEAVGGYADIDHLPSGDDILLLLKINDHIPKSIRYCADQEAVVHTQPARNFKDFWQQRLRWVSKVRRMRHPATGVLMGSGWLFNTAGLAWVIATLFSGGYWWYGLPMLAAKVLVEGMAIALASRKLGQTIHWGWYPIVALCYLPYVAVVGILGNFMPYRWKGRTIRPTP